MPVKATLTDLQTRRVYHGNVGDSIVQGEDFNFDLGKTVFRVVKLRGWLISDSDAVFYLFDWHGKRFKVRIKDQVIDSKP